MGRHRKCTHDAPRYANGACSICHNERRKARRQADLESTNAYNRNRRVENPERECSYGREYRKSATFAAWYARNRHRELWKKAKQRATKSGREFTITIQDVEKLLTSSLVCPYTLVPYEIAPGRNPWAASLDRKDSSKGYTIDNIEVTSLWWNIAKNGWPPAVVEKAVSGLRTQKA